MKKESSYMTEGLKHSIRPNPNGDWPQVDPTAYIDPTAQIIGKVQIGARVYVGPNAVIRADEADDKGEVKPIEIGPECNVQDGAIVHALGGTHVTVGQRTSLAHGCIIHGPCTIGEGCFIGFRAVMYNATLGDRVFVSTSAIVQGVDLIASALVPPAVRALSREHVVALVGTTGPDECELMEKVATVNLALAKGYIRLNEQEQKGLVE
jgi:carbonic anhydrase/acetyltransferase-like protein (isoleucine patch superfamily)